MRARISDNPFRDVAAGPEARIEGMAVNAPENRSPHPSPVESLGEPGSQAEAKQANQSDGTSESGHAASQQADEQQKGKDEKRTRRTPKWIFSLFSKKISREDGKGKEEETAKAGDSQTQWRAITQMPWRIGVTARHHAAAMPSRPCSARLCLWLKPVSVAQSRRICNKPKTQGSPGRSAPGAQKIHPSPAPVPSTSF
ncbi:hypothetical protein VTJ49DRAFT_7268 [Mycothermus thermophilus]|uniref:Uncharacterized protein n=1 Tax=Humicola insolens TaxID=85995 RepID=A0ABR3VHM7_HUMIN